MRVGKKVTRKTRLLSYAVAVFSVALAVGISLSLGPLIRPTPTSLFFVAVMVSAWWGGLGPGLVATVLSTLAIHYGFIAPYHSLNTPEVGSIIRLGVFVMAALLISGLNESCRNAMRREQRLRADSEAAQGEAHAAKERLETVLASINDGFYRLDRSWRFTYVNDRFCQITGMEREDVLNESLWDLFPDIVDTDFYRQFQRALSEQTSIQFEYLYTAWNRWYEHRVYPAPDGLTVFAADITERKRVEDERKRTENAVRQSEEQARLAIKVGRLGTWRYSLTTHWVVLDERMREIWGEPAAVEALPLPQVIARIHPDDRERVAIAINAALAPGTAGIYEADYRIIWNDGSERWVSANGQAQFADKGASQQPVGFFGTALDITDRKQAEMALAAQEQRYRYIFEAVNVPIWEEDFTEVKAAIDQLKAAGIQDFRQYFNEHPDFVQQAVGMVHLRDVNQAALQLFGAQSKAELLTSLHQIFTPETQDAFIAELLSIAAEETYFAAETVLQTLQGDRLYVWFAITFPPAAAYDRVLVSLVNMSDRKRAEENLRLSENRYRTLANAVAQLMWVNNAQGKVQFYNQQWQAYTGVDDLELNVGLWADILHPDDLQPTSEKRAKAIQAGEAYEVECRLKRVDQTYRWHLARVVPLKDDQGQILYWYGTATDIDDRKQIEAEREQLLAREQAAREAAETANRIKDEFLAVVSHELRSPLNPILGWSRLLQANRLDPIRTQQALTTIERNAQLQAELIEDLLDVSRILQGKLSLTVSPVNLTSIVKAAIETVRLAAEAKSIEVRSEEIGDRSPARVNASLLPPISSPPMVLGDPTRLQQVVWNLLSNAVKFTPAGGQVEVRLSLVTGEQALAPGSEPHVLESGAHDRFAQITVSDTGKGIAPDFLPHVFDYFRQADSATTRSFGGLGLGLAIVRHLVELHGGTIRADSPGEGLGATFTVRMPLMPTQPAVSQDFQLSEPTLDLSGIRVLVVDDDTDTRDFTAFLLEQAGAKVITSTSAAEAVAALTQYHPDVLVSDIGMPGTDGYMLIRQIRALSSEQGGQIPAIALTAYAGESDQQQALQAGFQRHVSKPVEPEVLLRTIDALTRHRQPK
ncbi:PAS domain S-box protein [Pseudanabaena sp. FACHB-2040]|uniref:hybrid sensor histidine kinase/response regulator n=1 Tax=Pseudanabaena sp. FACHB-2040 TaxID=2692859 RepID=UPI001681F80F|nr:PAS domain S-box protein [Pseudanabaena sp. FACHB-2040]MBD2260545.1 PAS domain S-box protein [Pseudanabaena sp. FACHB-2040]